MKMASRWSEAMTFKFVQKYMEYDCLWNVIYPNHKNKRARQEAYADLAETMNIPGFGIPEAKMKIKNLRSTYSQELKKIRDSAIAGAGPDSLYRPLLKWFYLMDAGLRDKTPMGIKTQDSLFENTVTEDQDIQEDNPPPASASIVADNFRELKRKLPIGKNPLEEKKIRTINKTPQVKKDIAQARISAEEFDVFGKHVALQLKSLPLLLALETQECIQLYINRIRREHLERLQTSSGVTISSYFSVDSPYSEETGSDCPASKSAVEESDKATFSVEDSIEGENETEEDHNIFQYDIVPKEEPPFS